MLYLRQFGPQLRQRNFIRMKQLFRHVLPTITPGLPTPKYLSSVVKHLVKVHVWGCFPMQGFDIHRLFKCCQNGQNIPEGFITNWTKTVYKKKKTKLATARGHWPKISESSLYYESNKMTFTYWIAVARCKFYGKYLDNHEVKASRNDRFDLYGSLCPQIIIWN